MAPFAICLPSVWEMFYCRDPYDGLLDGQICVGVTGGWAGRRQAWHKLRGHQQMLCSQL